MISAAVQTSLFIAQWILILEMLWISCIVIPFTIMAIAFKLLEWFFLDTVTNFLVSGTWNSSYNIVFSSTAPIMIMLYIALIFGFIFSILFLLNYFGKNINSISGFESIRKMFWLFSILLFIVLIPFLFLFFSIFIKFCSNLAMNLFKTSANGNAFINNDSLKNSVIFLTNNLVINNLDQSIWDNIWSNVTDTNALELKNQIFNQYNIIINNSNKIQLTNILNLISLNLNNPAELKIIFDQKLINDFNNLLNDISKFNQLNLTLKNFISNEQFEQIQNLFSVGLNENNIIQTTESFSNLVKFGTIYSNLIIENNVFVNSSNIGFVLYTAVTGIYVNSINGITGNITFLSALFQSEGIVQLAKSIAFGALISISTYKAIFSLIMILINRWYSILVLIPFGAISLVRSSNDNGDLFKIWIREIITTFCSLFVVVLNYQILIFLISIIKHSFVEGNIKINDINTTFTISVLFAILIVLLIYACVGLTNKILETFNSSPTNKNSGINTIVSEYNKNQSRIQNKSNKANTYKKQINRQISARKNSKIQKIKDQKMDNFMKTVTRKISRKYKK